MSTPISAYSFLPWARTGLGTYIGEADLDGAVRLRGAIDVRLSLDATDLDGEAVHQELPPRPVELYGPGDLVGVDSRAIIRNEPRDWITNFETNYIPFVEFYDEDFPWRYTPAAPSADKRRLRPWLALVVLEESEIASEGAAGLGRPLSFVEVVDAATRFPPAADLWAWAHVHLNGGLDVDPTDTDGLAAALDATVRADRDQAYSRLLCPRILKPNTGYHAFVLPTFESGRLAGLGKDPAGAPFATESAWSEYAGREDANLYPYYHRWYFRTASVGDFEYLVRLLQPRTVKPEVGRRDIDVQAPGATLPGIPEFGGILRLGGALRAPLATLSPDDLADYTRFEEWGKPYPHAFQTALASFVNLADAYRTQAAPDANAASGLDGVAADEDPMIVAPLYGRWHAQVQRLVAADADPASRHWVEELNLDPRHRVAAGFGTHIVQQNQETYMEAAWQQVGKVLEANQKIRFGQLATLVATVWHTRELQPMLESSPESVLTFTAAVQRRVVSQGLTVHHRVRQSALPATAMSKTMRQVLRPRGRVSRLIGFDATRNARTLLARMNLDDGDPRKVSAAPPKQPAPVLPTGPKLADELMPGGLPRDWADWLRARPWVLWLLVVLGLALVVALLFVVPYVAAALAVALMAVGIVVFRSVRRAGVVSVLDPANNTPASVDALPSSPDFHVGTPGQGPAPTTGATDSADAVHFKDALHGLYTVDVVERELPVTVRVAVDAGVLAQDTLAQLEPAHTIPGHILGTVRIPPRITAELPAEDFGEVMVYPEIDIPMYEPLKDASSEMFLPNLQLIENNSVTLLETNQKFIESYMVGLNHEFARELLWREYPTDQRGSSFRQFWDVRGFLTDPDTDPAELRERMRDIPELHRWSRDSGLEEHDHREALGDKEDEVVLVIRGELLKKYPTAVIYAHRAEWERTNDGAIDTSKPRKLAALTEAQAVNPSRDLVKSPLYEAKVDPDIYFFGFDLTVENARGGQLVDGEEDPGWFFVIKERPGEPRFGLDIPQSAPQTVWHTWNDLAWTDVTNAFVEGAHLTIGEKTVTLTNPGSSSVAKPQYDEDKEFAWRVDTHAAELAYILYQVPVLMAVHAAEMLTQPE
jgi:hypothetical protein